MPDLPSFDDLSTLPASFQAVIPTDYLDDMGHMNVMWYTHLFSCGMIEFFKSVGLTREYFESNHAGSFALEAHIGYYAEVRVDKHVTVRTRALGRSAKRLHVMHLMSIDEDRALAATGEFVSTHIDMAIRRSSPLPEATTAAFDRLLTEHERLPWAAPACGVMRA